VREDRYGVLGCGGRWSCWNGNLRAGRPRPEPRVKSAAEPADTAPRGAMWTAGEVRDASAAHPEIAQMSRKITERMLHGMGRRCETTALLGLLEAEPVKRSSRLRKTLVSSLNPRRTGKAVEDPAVRMALMDLVEHDRNRHVRTRTTNALTAIGARADVPF
jgi:hypothetical protein